MESSLTLFIRRDPSGKTEDTPLSDTESTKCFEGLFCSKRIAKLFSKTDVSITCADDTMSTTSSSSLSSSPKQPSNKISSYKRSLDPNFTLKDIATKRKYIKRIDSKQVYEDLLIKKVKKSEDEAIAKEDNGGSVNEATVMLVWEDGKAKITDLQEKAQAIQSIEQVSKSPKPTTSHSFKRMNHAVQWTTEETNKFYRVK